MIISHSVVTRWSWGEDGGGNRNPCDKVSSHNLVKSDTELETFSGMGDTSSVEQERSPFKMCMAQLSRQDEMNNLPIARKRDPIEEEWALGRTLKE